jgi:hypothetical protein
MVRDPIPAIARVECRSEGRGEEHPVAVVFGGTRLEIKEILDRAMVTSVAAGDPVRHRLWVTLIDGQRCELVRVLPDGEWRVSVSKESGTGTGTGTNPPIRRSDRER